MDPILFWNGVALDADRTAHTSARGEVRGPTQSSRALGIVHLAMYDAYAGARGNPPDLPPYLPGLPPPPVGASAGAAAAAAAHLVLGALYPSQRAAFDAQLSSQDHSGPGAEDGRRYGVQIGRALLADRAGDPDDRAAGHVVAPRRGHHRPDPDLPEAGVHAPFYGARSRGFAVSARHQVDEPPALDGPEYLHALREVRAIGGQHGGRAAPARLGVAHDPASAPRRRSDGETLVARFWAYDGAPGVGCAARLYNQIVRVLARARGNSTDENARLFALVNAALADAAVLAWDQKFAHDLWRPIHAIRERERIAGSDQEGAWCPLGTPRPAAHADQAQRLLPSSPAYPSGHATLAAAALQTVRLFYGHGTPGPDPLFERLSLASDALDGGAGLSAPQPARYTREFPGGLWQMIEESARSRVLLGLGWSFAGFAADHRGRPDLTRNLGGLPLGLQIAEDIFGGGRASGLRRSRVGPR